MKIFNSLILVALMILSASPAIASDRVARYSIPEVLASGRARARIGKRVKFFFGDTFKGDVQKSYGVFKTNKKTNAFLRSDKEACEWVFIAAVKTLRDRAIRQGGNAVINIKSNYKNDEISLNDQYTCGAGGLIAGTSLKGEVVRLKSAD